MKETQRARYELERRPGLLPVYRVYLVITSIYRRNDGSTFEYVREEGPLGFFSVNMKNIGWRRLGRTWAEARGSRALRKFARQNRVGYGTTIRYKSVEEVIV